MAAKKAVNGLGIYFLVRDGEEKTDRTIYHKKVDRPAISSVVRSRERLAGRSHFTDFRRLLSLAGQSDPLRWLRPRRAGFPAVLRRGSIITSAESKIPKFCLRRSYFMPSERVKAKNQTSLATAAQLPNIKSYHN